VLYQPIVYMPTEELAGFEALLRWEHPKHGLINPFGYLDWEGAADLWAQTLQLVLNRAMKDCAVWQKELPRADNALFVNFNLPMALKVDQAMAQEVRQVLARCQVVKGSLKLGVPEAMVMDNPEHAGEMLEWLRSAGADLVLDDFCSGYSSLLYLGRLPFEAVRIDRGLLDGTGGPEAVASGMLRAVTSMTHELGRKVIVHGVENDEDVSYLRSIECEYGEGYYYGDPIDERDVLQLLKLVRKSERRMQPRGLFRAGAKKKRKDEAVEPAAAVVETPSVAAPQEGAPVPATAGAAAGQGASLAPPSLPVAADPQVPPTQPMRNGGLQQQTHVRPRGPMPAAVSNPPPNSAPPVAAPAHQFFGAIGAAPMAPEQPQPLVMPGPPLQPAGFDAPPPMPPVRPVPEPEATMVLPQLGPLPPVPFAAGAPPPHSPPQAEAYGSSGTAPFANGSPPEPTLAPPSAPLRQMQPAGSRRPATPVRATANFDKLPPNIAASLQRLAGAPPAVASDKPDTDAAE
jgi:EAL domain-containing protein (putative c-di-GMP-specific phosphodiesterase class I)